MGAARDQLSTGSSTLNDQFKSKGVRACAAYGCSRPLIHATEPGTDIETLIYTGCHQKGNEACEAKTLGGTAAKTIETAALKSELAYATKAGSEKSEGAVDTLFKPASGTTFVEVELNGTMCPVLSQATITGSVATENGAEAVEPTLTAPATPISEVFHSGGTKVNVSLKAFGFVEAAYIGTAKIKMTGANSGKKLGVAPGAGAGAQWLTVKNVGGEAKEEKGFTCWFTAVGKKCQIARTRLLEG